MSLNKGKWSAECCGKWLGRFNEERDAGKAVAREAISRWGDWAAKNDLLIGPGLLTAADILTIQQELTLTTSKEAKSLPRGVSRSGVLYWARHAGKDLGRFQTIEEAATAYIKQVSKVREEKWINHLMTPVYRDKDGDAAIILTGKNSSGHSAKCPEGLWHQLTFSTLWWYDGKYACGTWDGKKDRMHRVVYKLCNPDWDGKLQVDHKIPERTLDNQESNLRIATQSFQAYNKCKRQGTTSKYIGVRQEESGKWSARINKDGVGYYLGSKFLTCHDAACALNAKAIELWGQEARILTIDDEAGSTS